jgi:hypothetical protein
MPQAPTVDAASSICGLQHTAFAPLLVFNACEKCSQAGRDSVRVTIGPPFRQFQNEAPCVEFVGTYHEDQPHQGAQVMGRGSHQVSSSVRLRPLDLARYMAVSARSSSETCVSRGR